MSSPRDLEVGRGLALLDRLHATLAAFAKEDSELSRRLRDRRSSLRRSGDDKASAAEVESRSADAAEAEIFSAEKRRLSDLHESRRRRIQTLHRDGLRNLPRLAREERERWLGELQMQEFLATRRLDADRQAAHEEFDEFTAALARQGAVLRRLEQRSLEYFLGYLSLLWKLRRRPAVIPPAGPGNQLTERLRERLDRLHAELTAFRRIALPRVFSFLPLPAVIVLLAVVVFLLQRTNPGASGIVLVVGLAFAGAIIALHAVGKRQSQSLAEAVVTSLAEARALHQASREAARANREQTLRRLEAEQKGTVERVTGEWSRGDEIKIDFEARVRRRFETRSPRAIARNDAARQRRLDRLEIAHAQKTAALQAAITNRREELTATGAAAAAALDADEAGLRAGLAGRWRAAIEPVYAEVAAMNAASAAAFPPWDAAFVENWEPPRDFLPVTKFARLEVDLHRALGEAGSRLPLPGPSHLSIPLALTYPEHGSLLFEGAGSGNPAVMGCLNHVILQLLTTTPPGRLSFTIIDPVGLGRNFAGLMHLGDYEEGIIGRRIWTQADQIEERLAESSQHIEKVIQMYLRNEYATIAEYNEQAGSTAEKFHFLVVADFPANFSETALKRLQSILSSGPRCGVYAFIHWDQRQPLPPGFVAEDLRRNSVRIEIGTDGPTFADGAPELDLRVTLDAPPEGALALELTRKIGERSVDAGQVQVPFRAIAPEPGDFWTGDTTQELRVAIGRTGATKRQMLAIGKGTRQHALIAGKTGSGKSTLFHVLITNLALSCSPAQVEFYLVDFKKGVEFKCYATKRLPHARVVAIESDREFGLSVLQRVDEELRRRGDTFRRLGVQDLAGYQRTGSAGPMPRSLLLIDEFQEFFVEDDAIAQEASVLLDRIVRQGRAFGIHVVLGSQTLGGAYSLARATLGQMVIRIALQCNEADAYLIMDDGNPAPRLLSRPGEGIYNDSAGAIEGNSPFQVVWLPEEERDTWLDQVRALARRHPALDASPIVFEGNAPADLGENPLLEAARRDEPTRPPTAARAWLGAPNSIKGPTEAAFPRQSGRNLLIVGQRDEAALTMLAAALLSLAAQFPAGAARFLFLHHSPPGSAEAEFIGRIAPAGRHDVLAAAGPDVIDALGELARDLENRAAADLAGGGVETFVFIHGLQRFKKLRPADDFDFSAGESDGATKPGAQFAELVAEGSAHGIHLLVAVDTFNSVNRFLNRKALSEFEMRVVFQMSANDSASLVDSPAASGLGLHRALFYNEHEGTLETFRPYARPEPAWIENFTRKTGTPGRI